MTIVIMQIICAKDHGGPKCPSIVPFEILYSKRPFEVASFEHFGLEWPFNMTALIVFTPKYPSEGDICPVNIYCPINECVLGKTCN